MSLAGDLARALRSGDRRALSKAITLVESTREDDRSAALELLSTLGVTGEHSFRIGVTGVPGAGKSTLIEALGLHAIAAGKRVAVLAVDPSSQRTGGSVLGDKTRMTRLSGHASAYVRPSPTLGVLGGTAGRTREVIGLCEAAGYDSILVETVGVGQSEERVASMVDCVLLLVLAGAGDELQTLKRGLLESADLIAFNKADGDRARLAENESAALRASLSISRPHGSPAVLTVSGQEGNGVVALWSALVQYQEAGVQNGSLAARRSAQLKAWFGAALDEALLEVFVRRPDLLPARVAAEQSVESGATSPLEAAQRLVAGLLPTRGG